MISNDTENELKRKSTKSTIGHLERLIKINKHLLLLIHFSPSPLTNFLLETSSRCSHPGAMSEPGPLHTLKRERTCRTWNAAQLTAAGHRQLDGAPSWEGPAPWGPMRSVGLRKWFQGCFYIASGLAGSQGRAPSRQRIEERIAEGTQSLWAMKNSWGTLEYSWFGKQTVFGIPV